MDGVGRTPIVRVNPRDLAAGAVFIAIGLGFGLNAWANLRIGQANAMGPGYFPLLLAALLIGFGVAIALSAIGQPAAAMGRVSWRGVALVTASIVFFAATVRGLGMAPALGGATVMAAMSSGRMSLPGAVLLGLVLTVFSIGVFLFALQLPYPVIGPWLRG